MPSDEEYKLLADSPHTGDDASFPSEGLTLGDLANRRRYTLLRWTVVGETLAILTLLAILLQTYRTPKAQICSQLLYSPVQDEIVYETRRFQIGNRSSIIYSSDPSDEVDRAWNDLYNDFGISQISKAEAMRLPNKTVPLPASPSHYVMTISAFHQLHCLNVLRKVIHSDYYADPVTGNIGEMLREDLPEHVGHCLDMLRQGVMCAADISPIVWHWNDEMNEAIAVMSIAHSCRNWDRISDWAKDHQLQYSFNKSIHVQEQ